LQKSEGVVLLNMNVIHGEDISQIVKFRDPRLLPARSSLLYRTNDV
jgi:hypothetical protein